jgi:hypothetical protein
VGRDRPTLVYSVSYIDRQMLSLLIGPIQRDLHVSDTGIGMLTGLAFAGCTRCSASCWAGWPTPATGSV